MGASREEIKGIKDSINQIVRICGVKHEDMSDKIGLLKRIEIKLNEAVEQRKVFSFFDSKGLSDQEVRIRAEAKAMNVELIIKKKQEELESREAKL